MKINKRKSRVLLIILVIAISIMILSRIVYINIRYPQTKLEDVSVGTLHQIEEGLEMRVDSSRWIDEDKIKSKYGDVWSMEEGKYKIIEVDIEIINRTNKKMGVSLFKTYIENEKHDWNGADEDLYIFLNDSTLQEEIEPGESKKYIMPYSFYIEDYDKEVWNKLDSYKCFLVRDRYPIKTRWMI